MGKNTGYIQLLLKYADEVNTEKFCHVLDEVGIGIDLVEICNGYIIFRAFIFKNVFCPEDLGKIFVDNNIAGVFDDEGIDAKGFLGQLVLRPKFEYLFIVFQFKLDSLIEGGMPENRLFVIGMVLPVFSPYRGHSHVW
jgi:hypothetical protein